MELKNITVRFDEKKVYDSFHIAFPENKITCILGASGCGKTTLLNVIAGTVPYTGEVVDKSKKIGFIFQNPTLFSHLTVEQNIQYVLKKDIKDKKIRKEKTEKVLREVELYDDRKKYPEELSGGMAQRVSLARAFAYESDLLLLDEPFKGMDISLKKKVIDLFIGLYEKRKNTAIMVTHDLDEAILLADKIVVLSTNCILYEKDLSERSQRSINDFPEIREEIYKIL